MSIDDFINEDLSGPTPGTFQPELIEWQEFEKNELRGFISRDMDTSFATIRLVNDEYCFLLAAFQMDEEDAGGVIKYSDAKEIAETRLRDWIERAGYPLVRSIYLA